MMSTQRDGATLTNELYKDSNQLNQPSVVFKHIV